ncbi:hypothetical protein [Bacillus pseudomycoides]|uniref:hypothetical protein n=1 Tax=Bacillus pseudomycoides TaxID=64104 RepID=UPI000BED0D9C|nr:hypothetical protein [Bacillus pseudomycoides]PEE04600.1 hypothetical protein CON86_19405 [Bacillus pseudomycoides]PGE91993.1 hypothetical protein COM62_28575 [Bacillus pseudomycoides]PHC87243.1 hypothetical protein COF63_08405 [Bacillus pseudomycoides]PHE30343.1 hypothetical protein COF51_27080 [Bacillus pseudomycoides]
MRKPLNYRLRLKENGMQFFSEGGDNPPVTSPEGGDPIVTDPNPTPPATDPNPEPPVTFTQEQMDAAKKDNEAALFKKLGVENMDQLKETMKSWNEHQESLKTDQEKQNEKLTTYETQIKEKDESLFNLQAENAAIRSGITEEKNLNAVIALARPKVTGDVDITAAIAQVVADFPHFKDVVEQPPADSGKPKPTFSNGQHQQTTMTDSQKWADAFKVTKY